MKRSHKTIMFYTQCKACMRKVMENVQLGLFISLQTYNKRHVVYSDLYGPAFVVA